MLKKLLFITICFILLNFSINSYANSLNEPTINIRDNMPVLPYPTTPSFWFNRELGKSEVEITNKFIKPNLQREKIFYDKLTKNIDTQLKALFINNKGGLQKGIYLLDKNTDKTVGYNLLEQFNINNNLLNTIKTLTLNSLYLQNEIIQKENITVKFYEKIHNESNYIERYAITTDKWGSNELVMDAFYPNNMEEYFKPYIISNINTVLDIWNKYWNGEPLN